MNTPYSSFFFPPSIQEAVCQTASMQSADHVFVLVDTHTACHCLPLLDEACKALKANVITIPAGEEHKTLTTATHVWQHLTDNGATRHSLLVNLGGGMVCDMGGFVAATFKRGIPFVNIPTTLLAMVDAASGGKNGVNFNGLKNEIGTFAIPKAVLVSPQWLSTLPEDELLSGYGEMIKHALLADEHHWADVMNTEPAAMAFEDNRYLLQRSQQVKTDIVAKDPLECSLRKVLNLGHTTAHALETLQMEQGRGGVRMPHGHAVAHGLVVALYLSSVLRDFPSHIMRQTTTYIRSLYGRPAITCDDYDALFGIMMHDKKNTGPHPSFVLLDGIGRAVTDQRVEKHLLYEAFDFLREG